MGEISRESQLEPPMTGTEWARREQLEMLHLGVTRIVDEHDPEGELTMMP